METQDNFKQTITTHYIDGKTIYGPWATMTPASFWKYGVGLGLGQCYYLNEQGEWITTNIIPQK